MISLLREVFTYEAVFADKPIDKRFHTQAAETDFAVRNHEARLNDVARADFCLHPFIDNLEIEPALRNLSAFNAGAFHGVNGGKYSGAKFEIVKAAVAIREECSNLAVKDTNHPAFRLVLQPRVHV